MISIFFKMLRCKLYNFKLTVNQMAKQTMNCISHRRTWNATIQLVSWQLWCQPNTLQHFISLRHLQNLKVRCSTWMWYSSKIEESWISSISKEASQLLEKCFSILCNTQKPWYHLGAPSKIIKKYALSILYSGPTQNFQ
jgi:hypothetical protein